MTSSDKKVIHVNVESYKIEFKDKIILIPGHRTYTWDDGSITERGVEYDTLVDTLEQIKVKYA